MPPASLTCTLFFLYNKFITQTLQMPNGLPESEFISITRRKEMAFMDDADPEGETNYNRNKKQKPIKGIAC